LNKLDKQYLDLVEHILLNGYDKSDRTGTGTSSIFGMHITHNMKDGFPILTTKEINFENIVSELIWFLRGDTNIKYLVENGNNIWVGDCFSNYLKDGKPLTRKEFIHEIKTNIEFAKKWGELGPIYGKQWRNWNIRFDTNHPAIQNKAYSLTIKDSIDQISDIIHELRTNPDSRRMLVSAWNPADLPVTDNRTSDELYQIYLKDFTQSKKQ